MLLATFKVINTNNDGMGSLREAIGQVNSDLTDTSANPDQICFDIPTTDQGYNATGGLWTITPTSSLSPIMKPVIINGTSQPSYTNRPVIVISGGSAPGDGLVLLSGSDHSTIEGLDITGFSGAGIHINADYNIIQLNIVISDQTGVLVDSESSTVGATGNTIGATTTGAGNSITRNQQNGILIGTGGAGLNVVVGNTIGQNRGNGVEVLNTKQNTIGGPATARNFIFGSTLDGILITGDFTSGNLVEGNWIGTDTDGTGPFGNSGNGVEIESGGSNTIGGTTDATGNVISGNLKNGVLIDSASPGNLIEGNFIGTDFSGLNALPNQGDGVGLSPGVGDTIAGNVVSGNQGSGIRLSAGSSSNTVQGNSIGTDASGLRPLPNSGDGVDLTGTATTKNIIGGTAVGAGNVIAANKGNGIGLTAGAVDNTIEGNFIGTNESGGLGLGNQENGVEIDDSDSNIIGGTTPAARNFISGNGSDGVLISGGSENVVEGNFIGTNLDGTAPLGGFDLNFVPQGNNGNGIEITSFALSNIVGGPTTAAGNLISGNKGAGVLIDTSANASVVQGNLIGTDASGVMAVANSGDGVQLSTTEGDAIGGPDQVNADGTVTRMAGNVISGNYGSGISFDNVSQDNVLEGNFIGTDASGLHALPNNHPVGTHSGNLGYGVLMSKAYHNTIGGTNVLVEGKIKTLYGNVIAGNAGSGIFFAIDTHDNQVLGNFIGLDVLGLDAVPNGGDGINSNLSAMRNTIGGAQSGDGNVISGNSGNGISLNAGATNNQVLGNLIGTVASGLSALPNTGSGVYLAGATSNTIGGTAPGARNVISGNNGTGISLSTSATSNQVLGNFIGTDATGLRKLPNTFDGVDLAGATQNTIGGIALDSSGVNLARNVISGNGANGMSLTAGATNNEVLGNEIGTNMSGTSALPNTGDGVNLAGVTGNTIGGVSAGAGNVISGNAGSGINLNAAANGNQVLGNLIGTDLTGELPVNNAFGISISAASGNTVGGTAPAAANVISGNTSIGIQISNSLASENIVLGNLIGTNKEGDKLVSVPDLKSGFPVGVFLNDSPANQIGGASTGAGNVISGFGVAVYVSGFDGSGNAILGNSIGTVRTAPNGIVLNSTIGVGVYINGVGGCTVGGSTTGARNVIQDYANYGVLIFGSLAKGNVVQGNQIGVVVAQRKKKGVAAEKVQLAAVAIQDASQNTVGGSSMEAGNTITGNVDAGVYIFGHGNSAQGNHIAKNRIQKNLYGVLLFNAPNNGSYSTLKSGNKFTKNQIANVREFTGAVNSPGGASRTAAVSPLLPGHQAVRPRPRPSASHFHARRLKGHHAPPRSTRFTHQ
jgi:parallel beta-helix repeat protein